MFDKTVRSIIKTGRAHRCLKPLALFALALLFCGAALARWATSRPGRALRSMAALTRRRGERRPRPSHRPAARAAAMALAVCMVFTLMPSTAFSAEAETGLCEHHPAHTSECGYSEARPAHACEHEHTAGCYTDELICGLAGTPAEAPADGEAGHAHTQSCYKLDCPHERGEHKVNGGEADRESDLGHAAGCGYTEAAEGTPCGYACAKCGQPVEGGGPTGGNDLPPPQETGPEAVPPEAAERIVVTAFDELGGEVRDQAVAAGTPLEELILPNTLSATAQAGGGEPEPVVIGGVTWKPGGPWNETAESGDHVFTPVLPEGYALADGAELPKIDVRVGGPKLPETDVPAGGAELPEAGVRAGMQRSLSGDPADADGYHDGDVAAINAMIRDNSLSAEADTPSSWNFAVWNTESPKRISKLSLTNKKLTGTLDVSGLTSLTYLDCYGNQLTDLRGLSGLTGLTYLSCYNNKLTSLDVSGLTNLTYLNCGQNLLAELLGLGGLTHLKTLSCYDNQLPDLPGLGSLTSLTQLNCYNNKLTGLPGLGNLTNLTSLTCAQNPLGKLPGLGSLTNLKQLSCYNNELTELPDLSSLTNLTSLTCAQNQLPELPGLGSLTNLTSLTCYDNKLTELTGLGSLTKLKSLTCQNNKLTALDVSGLTELTSLSCANTPLAFLKLSDTLQLTVGSAEGGAVKLTGYTHSSHSVTLRATANSGYIFKGWTASGTTLADAAANPVTFMLGGSVTIIPVFENQQAAADAQAVAAAKAAIEGSPYTVAQATANSESDVKAWLAAAINGLAGMSGTGITVAANDIAVTGFTAATAGNADAPSGADGSFSFTVALSKGMANATANKNGSITATAFTGQSNAQAVAAAKAAIEGGPYTVAQATANSESDVKAWLAAAINGLAGMSGTGITVAANDIAITGFTAATAGNADAPSGADGSFSFTVALSKGTANATANQNGSITATAFTGQSNAQAVAAAKAAIEGGPYTVAQATANSESDVKAWLAAAINGLAGMSGSGITVAANDITVTGFTAATAGNADAPSGADGSFTFTVALSKGAANATANKNGFITATAFTGQSNAQAVAAAKAAIEGGPYTVAQATANSESDVKAWLAAAINGLAGMSGTGITVAANDIAITDFTAATAGNADAPSGTDGSFSFTVALSKGTANATANKNGSITATAYSAPGGSSGQGDPSGPSGESESAGAAIQALAKPKIPAAKPEAPAAGLELPTAGATQPMTPDQNGGVTVKHDAVSAAISAAKQDAQQKGSLNSGVAVTVPVNTAAGQSILNVTIPAPTLDELVGEQVVRFDLTTNDMVSYSFSRDTLAQLDANSQGAHIVLRAEKRAELIGAARAAVGSRPVYDVTMIYLESGKEVPASTLNGKTITIKLPYVLQEWEEAGNLYAVYVDDAGKVHWLTRSAYDPSQKAVIFEAPHFSVYGVAYKPAPVFTDTAGHWAKSDIDFAAGRGLLTGTGETTFGPDAPITRGVFAAALGRLAGIDPAAYPSSGRFADVAATAFCAPFVEWAAVQGIISGAGENTFRPDAAITREQMAAILCRYADRLGYTLPVSREAEIFADAGQIAGGMKEAVRAVQQAGVMSAKGGRCFAPNNSATRAEAAAALHRFVESVVDPSPAQGWVQNDAGRFLYYQGGKPTIGWKQVEGNWYYFDAAGLMECGGWRQIDGKRYYFFPGGALAANAKINDRRLEPGGARKKNRQPPPA